MAKRKGKRENGNEERRKSDNLPSTPARRHLSNPPVPKPHPRIRTVPPLSWSLYTRRRGRTHARSLILRNAISVISFPLRGAGGDPADPGHATFSQT